MHPLSSLHELVLPAICCTLRAVLGSQSTQEDTETKHTFPSLPWLSLGCYPSTVWWHSHLLLCSPSMCCMLQSVILCNYHRNAAEPSRVAEEYRKTCMCLHTCLPTPKVFLSVVTHCTRCGEIPYFEVLRDVRETTF